MLGIESKRIGLRKPSGNCGNQRRNEFFAHVHESEAGRAKQIFQSAGYKKIQVQGFHVNRASSAILVIVEHYESTGAPGDLRDGLYLGTKSILEADVRKGHDERIAVHHLFVIDSRNTVAFRTHKLHLGASNSLR